MAVQIGHPELLEFLEDGRRHYGADQDWFRSFWQRKAGCGPTTGAHIALYLGRTGRLNLPEPVEGREEFVRLMEQSWSHLTPTMMGLNSTKLMQDGLGALLNELGMQAQTHALDVPAEAGRRPGAAEAVDFIRAGLHLDTPVAFLNLHNGGLSQLETWHWVTVVGLEGAGEEATLKVYDNGNRLDIPLHRWLRDTRRGGGFVYAAAG